MYIYVLEFYVLELLELILSLKFFYAFIISFYHDSYLNS